MLNVVPRQDQDISTIIQAEQEINNNPCSIAASVSDSNGDEKSKDLSSIIERLMQKQHQSRSVKLTDLYDQIDQKLAQDENSRESHTLKLDKLGNANAVYQTLQPVEEHSDTKVEVRGILVF